MTQKTNISTKSQNIEVTSEAQTQAYSQVSYDLKNAVLIVSMVANLFVLTAWIAVQVTSRYDDQLANFLFNH